MQVSFSSLFTDSKNFIRNQFMLIISVLLIIAVISQVIVMIFMPSAEALIPVQMLVEKSISSYGNYSMQAIQMTLERMPQNQQEAFIGAIFSYLAKFFVISLINSLITTSVSLALIWNLSQIGKLDINQLLSKASKLLLPIILFLLVSIPFFLLLFVVATIIAPLMIFIIIIGCLFYFVIYTIFLAYIIDAEPGRLFQKISDSWRIFKSQYKLVLPMIALWIGVMLILNYIISAFIISDNIILNIVTNLITLLINFFVLSYFYRLCSLMQVTNCDSRD